MWRGKEFPVLREWPEHLAESDVCTFDLPCLVTVEVSARGKSASFQLAYVAAPSGAAVLTPKTPSALAGPCTSDGFEVTFELSNFKMVGADDALEVTFDKVVATGLTIRSSMRQTFVSIFLDPIFTIHDPVSKALGAFTIFNET